ncbi:MAG: hypothetical protein V4556_08385 [Bacteroidota bacterium]
MKKFVTFFCLLMAASISIAQVTLQPIVPSVGMVQKMQLWNLIILNNSSNHYVAKIEIVLRDRNSQLEILNAVCTINIPSGATQTNASALEPIIYNYTQANTFNSQLNILPVGAYIACYSLIESKSENVLASECINFDTEPLSPPMLINPSDSSELDIQPSQFTWAPPTPTMMFNNLQYQTIITEVYQGQTATEAIQNNLPFYIEDNLPINLLNYPSSNINFEKNKWYAWQIIAKDGDNYAAKSEAWIFKIKNDSTASTIDNNPYRLVQNDLTGTYIINDHLLRVKYFSYDKLRTDKINFYDDKGNVITDKEQKILSGDNYFEFHLNQKFKKDKKYKLVITDLNGKTNFLTFTIHSN